MPEGVSITQEKGRKVTIVLLVILAALILAGLWYVRGRRA
jgi:hypothetical protein